jgi:hypothetical protein
MSRTSILTLASLCFLAFAGCRAPNGTMWSATSASSDQAWLASARKEHTNHGFGGESVWTIVEMKQNIPDGEPVQVLMFAEDDGPDSVHDLKMSWPSPQHLDITYRGKTPITFQAIKAFGKDVTVEKLSES